MNKHLYLIRHAMASEKESGQKDIDRTLTTDGIQASTKTGNYFKQKKIQPDIIISSPAIRAQGTAVIISEQLKYNSEQIHLNDELYEASVRTFLQVVNRLKNDWNTVFIIAHNPSISYLAEYVTHGEIGSIEPAGIVYVQFPFAEWEKVSAGNGDFIEYQDPSTFGF